MVEVGKVRLGPSTAAVAGKHSNNRWRDKILSPSKLQPALNKLQRISCKFQTIHATRNLAWQQITMANRTARFIIVFLLAISGCSVAYSNDIVKVIPSAWVWKVSSPTRTIYLLGEFHNFSVSKDTSIDYQLGYDVYDTVSEVWQEAVVLLPSVRYAIKPLSARLSPETWQAVKTAINSTTDLLLPPGEKQVELNNKTLNGIEKESAKLAFNSLSQMSYYKYIFTQPKNRYVEGLGSQLRAKEKEKMQKKISEIEARTLGDDVYYEHCDTDLIAEELVKAGLRYFDLQFFWNSEKARIVQEVFADPKTTDEQLMMAVLKAFPDNDLLLKCNAKPRNLAWLPKIVDALQTEGPPIAILVGALHIVGEGGLLQLLKEKGYGNAHRIYSIPKP